ncbi:hypothetical protein HYX02_07865 [Candidatus Woesearchaeota archaeon]|nr:hypothetical protein [Candidatus Woesearchaeota archaeon]
MKPNSLKSQITMVMIVGLVLFIVISLILYLSKSSIKKQSQQSIKKIHETKIEIQPINDYATKCLDKLAKDAIVLLGKQGGYIYASQGGTLVDYSDTDEGLFYVKHNGLKVAYNILPPKFAIQPYSSETPDYPWRTFPYEKESSNSEIFEGYFGINNMPPLNYSEGPNSIQMQIESFIDSNMGSCMDLSIFEKQGVQISMQPSKTSATIGSGDISVTSKIPVKIANPSANEFTELSYFSTSINIRLRDIYFFAKELIENDIKNIKFDIGGARNNGDFLRVNLVKNAFTGEDLIVVSDERSLVYGKPFEYIFARRNRAPALHYIKNTKLEFSHNHQITQEDIFKNSTLKAYDPDEDNYTITITPSLPKTLNVPQIQFKVEASDGKLSDYQTITVSRI